MKKLCIMFGVMLSTSFNYTMLVTLPNATILLGRLNANNFKHFAKSTNIVQRLADKKCTVEDVGLIIGESLSDYYDYVQQPMLRALIENRRANLFKLILQDSPDAIKEGKELSLFE